MVALRAIGSLCPSRICWGGKWDARVLPDPIRYCGNPAAGRHSMALPLPLACRWTACSRGGGGNVGSGQVFWVADETRPRRFPSSRCSRRSSEWCRASLRTRLFTEKQQARCLVLRGQGEEPWLFWGPAPQGEGGAEGRNGRRCRPSTGRGWETGPDWALEVGWAPKRYSWRRASTGSMLAARQAG